MRKPATDRPVAPAMSPHQSPLECWAVLVALAYGRRIWRGEPGRGHGVPGRALGHRTVAGIARRLCRPGGAGQRRRRGHGVAAADCFRIVGRPQRAILDAHLAGYALTAICVPALAITPFVAGAGLALACVLILGERVGKAVRSPAKTALLAHAAAAVGLGRGFGVHQALDQVGAVAGPLLVAAVIAAAGAIWPAMAVLIIPGAVALLVLVRIRRSMGDPVESRDDAAQTATTDDPKHRESLLTQVPWPTAPRVLAVRSRLCCDDWRARHLRCRRLPPHARSCRTHRSRSVDLRRSHGRGGTCRARIRLAIRSHQRSHPGGPAAPRCGRAGSGVRWLAADRHFRCAALGRGSRSPGLHRIKALVADLVPA